MVYGKGSSATLCRDESIVARGIKSNSWQADAAYDADALRTDIHGIDSTHLTAVTAVGVAAGTQQEFRRRTLSGPIYFLVFWLSITAYALALLTLICAEDLVDIQNPQTQESNRRIHRWPIVTFFISLFFIRVSSLYEPPVVMTSMYNWGF